MRDYKKKYNNNKQQKEFNSLNDYSRKLISKNFDNIETELRHIYKSGEGYSIHRLSSENRWIVKININNNSIVINRGKSS